MAARSARDSGVGAAMRPARGTSRLAQGARIAYVLAAWAFALCVMAQVFLAGMAIFVESSWLATHVSFVHTFEWLTIVLLALAVIGRMPWALIALTVLLIGDFTLQYVFIGRAQEWNIPALAAFHPLNALLLFWLTTHLAQRGLGLVRRSG